MAAALFLGRIAAPRRAALARGLDAPAVRRVRAGHRRQSAGRMGRHLAVARSLVVLARQPGLGIPGARPPLAVPAGGGLVGLVCAAVVRGAPCASGKRRKRGRSSGCSCVAALAIPVFYIPALFFGAKTNYTVVDTWRFWIIHLWVEGFFEFFATTVVALTFYQLGLTRRNAALRVIYLDAILYFLGGLIGTGHHWYFTGQTDVNMALSALFSVLEVVPLTLLTLDAWDFVRTTRGDCDAAASRSRSRTNGRSIS